MSINTNTSVADQGRVAPLVTPLLDSKYTKSEGVFGPLVNLGQNTIRSLDSFAANAGESVGSLVEKTPIIGKHIAGPVAQVVRAVVLAVTSAFAAIAALFVSIGYTVGLLFPPFYDYFVTQAREEKKNVEMKEMQADMNAKFMSLLGDVANLKIASNSTVSAYAGQALKSTGSTIASAFNKGVEIVAPYAKSIADDVKSSEIYQDLSVPAGEIASLISSGFSKGVNSASKAKDYVVDSAVSFKNAANKQYNTFVNHVTKTVE